MSALYAKLNQDWTENFMLYASTAIIVSTCLGGIAVYTIFLNGSSLWSMIQVFAAVVMCTGVLASILTVQKPKIVLNTLLGSLAICILLIAMNLLF
ncbi:hypothetical protein [Gilvibacter sp.]|uniref:hypothetical protein n=1 Tax=Gilvibacter sp. TaxID=2729997 RepID=UPI0035BE809B